MFVNAMVPAALSRELAHARRVFRAYEDCDCNHFSGLIRSELVEKENGWDILLDLPGMDKEDLEIFMEKEELVVKGARNRPALGEGEEVQHGNRLFGNFERRYRLSDEIDSSRISAAMDRGVLKIELQKGEQALPRKIAIN